MDLIRTFLRHVRPGDTILDIGANIGGYAHLFRGNCPDATIHAFEPIPVIYAELRERYRDDPTIFCWNVGIGDRCEVVTGVAVHEAWTINRPGETTRGRNATYGRDIFDMPVITVDAFLLGCPAARVSAIKVDTDGYDFRVLRGASATIARWRPRILIEFGYCLTDLGEAVVDQMAYIAALDYQVYDEVGAGLDLQQWQSWYPFRTTADFLMVPTEQSLDPSA